MQKPHFALQRRAIGPKCQSHTGLVFFQNTPLLSHFIECRYRHILRVSQLYRFCISQNSVLLRQMPISQSCEPVRTDTAQAGRRVILHCINTNCLLWVVIMVCFISNGYLRQIGTFFVSVPVRSGQCRWVCAARTLAPITIF